MRAQSNFLSALKLCVHLSSIILDALHHQAIQHNDIKRKNLKKSTDILILRNDINFKKSLSNAIQLHTVPPKKFTP